MDRNRRHACLWQRIVGILALPTVVLLTGLLVGTAITADAWADASGRTPAAATRLVAVVTAPDTGAGPLASTQLAEVDPTSGSVTPFGETLPGCCSPVALGAGLDELHGLLFTVMKRADEAAPRVFTFDTVSGRVVTSPTLTVASTPAITGTLNVNYLAYDAAAARLVALAADVTARREWLAALDPATGVLTPLSPAAGCCTVYSQEAALDPVARRLMAVMTPYAGTPSLITWNLAADAYSSTLPLTVTVSPRFLAADPLSATLLAVGRAQPPLAAAQDLAIVNPATGSIQPFGQSLSGAWSLWTSDSALDAQAGVLSVPLLDTSFAPVLATWDVRSGAVLHQAALPVNAEITYVAYVPAPPKISLAKQATPRFSQPVQAGDTITYQLTAANNGGVTLTSVAISDPKALGLACDKAAPVTLVAGAQLTCIGVYTLTAADVTAGKVQNTAAVSSQLLSGAPGPSATAAATVTLPPPPHLTLSKQAVSLVPVPARAGDQIDYRLVATNDGGATLTNVTVTDPLLPALNCDRPAPVQLAVGEKVTCTASYALTAADLAARQVQNTAAAASKLPNAAPGPSASASVTVPLKPLASYLPLVTRH